MAGASGSKRPPSAVSAKYAELRRSYGFPVSLKRIGGRYYLYKQLIKWDKERKKYVCTEMKYLGAISDDGVFKPRKLISGDLDSARSMVEAHGGKITMPNNLAEQAPAPSTTELDRMILTELTMDARMQISELANKLGIDEKKVGYRIRSLENRLGIEYRPRIMVEKLGYLYFIVFAKFRGSRPDPDQLQKEISSISAVQFGALAANSKYDLILIVATRNEYNAAGKDSLPTVLKKLRMEPSLRDIKAEWYVSYFDIVKGFLPLRQNFVDEKLSNSVWTKGQPKEPNSLSRNEYAIIKALNQNGAESFRSVERNNGMTDGSAKYSFDRLTEKKVIDGVTICMNGIGVMYNSFLLIEIIDEGAYAATRSEVFRIETTERPDHLSNKIAMAANMGAPYGGMIMVPIFKDGDLEELQQEFSSKVNGIRVSGMVLTKILCGTLPYNRFDNTKSLQYEMLNASKVQEKI
jgi:DNA-binding Lrp family transcriptional regulator